MQIDRVFDLARHALLLTTVIACGYTDTARGKIYNVATISALLLGFALNAAWDAATPGPVRVFDSHVFGALLGFIAGGGLFGVAYVMRGMGAGDVKLMAAIGAISGSWRFTVLAVFYSALVGAVIGVGLLIWRGTLWTGLKRSGRLLITFGRSAGAPAAAADAQGSAAAVAAETFPYGIAISIGTMWAWVEVYRLLF